MKDEAPVLRLLACPPLPGVPKDDDPFLDDMSDEEKGEYLKETATFTAEVHVNFIKSVFDTTYHINPERLKSMLVCQTCDSAAVNVKIANDLEIPHIGCYNHKLHNQVEAMIKEDPNLRSKFVACFNYLFTPKPVLLLFLDCIKAVNDVMKAASTLKNAAMLRRLTHLKAEIIGGVRWESKATSLHKYSRMKPSLQEMETNDDTGQFSLQEVDNVLQQQAANYFGVIRRIHKILQYHLRLLYKCSDSVNDLFFAIEAGKPRPDSKLYHCKLGKSYFELTSTNRRIHSGYFESAVIKIQMSQHENKQCNLTQREKQSVLHLLKEEVNDEDENTEASDEEIDEIEQAKKRRKTLQVGNNIESRYINLDFILGSVAEVERLWSMAYYILVKNRQKMSPVVFEAIVFLKINKDMWEECDVIEAISRQRSARVDQQIAEDEEHLLMED